MSAKTKNERILVLDEAIKQRKALLAHIRSACEYYGEMTDFGWYLTLGSPPFGMLTAVTHGQEFRKWKDIANQVEQEILILLQSRNDIRSE